MATTNTPDPGDPSDPPGSCPSLEDMQKELAKEIAAFEARNLAQIKRDIDAFVPKKAAVETEYRGKYASLNDRWVQQNAQVADLWTAIRCHIKNWDEIARDCICTKLAEIDQLEEDINTTCKKGPNELARDEAKAAAGAAKAKLDALIANTQRLDAGLTANAKLIAELQVALNGKERAVAIWGFFFVLAPLHVQMTPEKASEECRNVLKGLPTPDEICGCASTSSTTAPHGSHAGADAAHAYPWLIDPDHFGAAIDCAWSELRSANDKLGKAENAFAEAPDDLASNTKKLADLRKALEGRIKDCLKTHGPANNPCEPAPETLTAEA